MTVALYDEVATVAPARTLTVVRDVETRPARKKATGKADAPVFAGDPLVDGATRLLSIPLRHLYAALLRAGVLEIQG